MGSLSLLALCSWCLYRLQMDNVFIGKLGWLKIADFGQVRQHTTCSTYSTLQLTSPPLQSLADYTVRHFFMANGTPTPFIVPSQVGGGAGTATSPEVQAAAAGRGTQGEPLWELMSGCDTWAAGRMMFEALLQCVMRSAEGGEAVGLPALASTSYTEASLPPLPKYSTGLRKLLTGMMAADRTKRLTPSQALARCQVLLWGGDAAPGASAVTLGEMEHLFAGCTTKDAASWLECQRARVCHDLSDAMLVSGAAGAAAPAAG